MCKPTVAPLELKEELITKGNVVKNHVTSEESDRGFLYGSMSLALVVTAGTVVMGHYQSKRDAMGCDTMCVGSMTSARSTFTLLGSTIIGRSSDSKALDDKLGGTRRAFLVLGVVASALELLVASRATSILYLWVSMIPSALFQQNFNVLKALFGEYHKSTATATERAGRVGELGMAAGLAFMAGPLLGSILFKTYQQAAMFASLCLFGSVRAEVPAGDVEGPVPVTVTNPDGESYTIANGFTYTMMEDPTVGFCQLQAQSPVSATAGMPTPGIFALVFTDGLTQGEGQGAMIEGQLGYGIGAEFEDFEFVEMTYNTDKDGLNAGDLANDEYGAELTIQASGSYQYVARFRLTSSPDSWVYCDLDGSENGVSFEQLGRIEVAQPTTPEVDFCQLTGPSPVTVETGAATETINAFVFSAGATEGGGPAASIVGELGFGGVGEDVGDFSYSTMTYTDDIDGLTPGDFANDQYGGTLDVGVAGDYRFAARFRLESEPNGWVYCDLDGSDNGIGDLPNQY